MGSTQGLQAWWELLDQAKETDTRLQADVLNHPYPREPWSDENRFNLAAAVFQQRTAIERMESRQQLIFKKLMEIGTTVKILEWLAVAAFVLLVSIRFALR